MRVRKPNGRTEWIVAIISTVAILILVTILIYVGFQTSDNKKVKDTNEQLNITETIEEIEPASPSEVIPDTVYTKFEHDINSLKIGDIGTIHRYFGESTGLASNESNKIFSHLKIKVVQETKEKANIEIDTVDWERIYKDKKVYSKQVKDSNTEISNHDLESYVSSYLSEQIGLGVYNITFKTEIMFIENTKDIEITENLKRAITGNWYYSLDCDIEPILEVNN